MISLLDRWNEAWDKDCVSVRQYGDLFVPADREHHTLLKQHAGCDYFHESRYDDVAGMIGFAGLCLEVLE